MRLSVSPLAPLLCLQALLSYSIAYNFSETSLVPRQLTVFDKRPDDCPPCFNCNLDDFKCYQFANCTQSSGRCSCPPGFGGDDCSAPLCGSLADGSDRPPRGSDEHECKCNDGWEGINCNVCKTNDACSALMPELKDGICYRNGLVQKENHQMCDVTNKKIVSILDPRRPQVTFSCNEAAETCNFQFWVDQNEAFYCALDTCTYNLEADAERNTTKYACENIHCRCVPGRTLCGEGGLDIGDFLKNEIKGPGSFTSISSYTDKANDGSKFEEPAMNNLISQVFGDDSITLQCQGGECLYKTDVPGYEKPIKTINTPLIAGVISGSALFVVAVILIIAWLSRRSATRQYGLLRLTDDDEADPALMADHKPTSLHFENVSYRVGGRQILSGVQGAVHPGEIMAIMGSSGAGKTTFLDLLARKNKRGVSLGDYYVNGERVADSEFRSFVGFVDQDDTLLPTLTVHETILDSAMLRLPRDMPLMAKEQKVEDVERQLGIFHIRDQLVGSEETNRGISGGEKRRVSIACELVTSPSILFLDEPTSGLDAYNAYNVVECLVTLVKTYNRTVVFTIHQPRSNIVALFDRLILLAKGRTVYSGSFANCQQYFDSIGYSCPPGFNIADYLVDLTMHAGVQRSPMDDIIDAELGRGTRSSSVVAVKSVASKSNIVGNASSLSSSPAPDGLKRPSVAQRQLSVRQQQEQALFTQRNSTDQGPDSPRSEADGGDESRDSSSWLRLSRQSGGVPPQAFDDPHNLPPETFATTGTDLDNMITSYYTSDVAASIQQDIRNVVSQTAEARDAGDANGTLHEAARRVKGYRKIGLLGQFRILSVRTWRNLYRDPMLMLTHYAIAILLAVLIGFLFYGLTDDIPGFQNRLGLLFFVLALFGFSTLTSLTVFASERLIFVRERAKGYYHPVAYFAAKIIFDIVPLRLIPPVILSIVVYPMTGLIAAWHQFSIFVAILVLFNFAAAAMCLFIGIVFRNGGVANLIGSLVMLFSLLFAGLLLNHDSIPPTVRWLQMSSIFHYGFEGLIVNEVRYLSLTEHKWGLDIEVPGASILSSFGFNVQAMVTDIVGLSVFTASFVVLGYLAMHLLLVERR